MLKSLDDPTLFFFSKKYVLVVKHDQSFLLLGPILGVFVEINSLQALVVGLAQKLDSDFTLGQLYRELSKILEVDPLIFLKHFNQLYSRGVVRDSKPNDDFDTYQIKFIFDNAVVEAKTFEHFVAHNWVSILDLQLKTRPEILNQGLFYGNIFNSKEKIFQEINKSLHKLFEILPKKSLPTIEQSRESLWKLHQFFEKQSLETLQSKNLKEKFNEELKFLNYLIHMAEDSLEGGKGGFIEVIFSSIFKPVLLNNCDHLFSPDLNEKMIYLNYYEIGYSHIAAFEAKTTSIPVPQTQYCANHFIYIRPDNIFVQNRRKELREWSIQNHNMDTDRAEARLGHIPLARITDNRSYQELCEVLRSYQKLINIEITGL
ncbi:MAG: hypothetical protein CME65_11450 [Halobacteriovoraceae bacterium]|nr:hypothetical protein [Halobacteriovoraceae bacterium]|tara:strand:+ start:17341 stop:18459 length:1119 start_codon:yes stop_codon:yes gene_type:complete